MTDINKLFTAVLINETIKADQETKNEINRYIKHGFIERDINLLMKLKGENHFKNIGLYEIDIKTKSEAA